MIVIPQDTEVDMEVVDTDTVDKHKRDIKRDNKII